MEDGRIRIGKRNAPSAEIRYGPGLSIDKQTEEAESDSDDGEVSWHRKAPRWHYIKLTYSDG